MPIYEYRCDQGHTFEATQRMSDDPLTSCETCAAPVQRVFHPVAVHFKGSGFYNTDYGTRKRERERRDSGEGGKAGGGDAGKAEAGKSGSSGDSGAAKQPAQSKAASNGS
jgi:putative FmdB family regulatory protein